MEPSKDILRLLDIMARLRDPDTGCAWDVEQTFSTISPYTIEEAYEVADAIERDDMVDLCDELGDLLLQVVFHSRIAEEAGHFNFGDVVNAVTTKMIRRHPHVFGENRVAGAQLAKGQWESIKDVEKAEKAARKADEAQRTTQPLKSIKPSFLNDVPRALPAPLEALKLQQRAARVGFDWNQPEPIFEKLNEEVAELQQAIYAQPQDRAHIESEWGDLAFVLINLARHLEIDPENALRGCNTKFRKRFAAIEHGLEQQDISLIDASLAQMEALWQEAKETNQKEVKKNA